MKKWLDSNDEIGKASIKKRRKELEEFARIGKIEDQMDSDLLDHHYHMNKYTCTMWFTYHKINTWWALKYVGPIKLILASCSQNKTN